MLFNVVQCTKTVSDYTSDEQLPYKIEILMWKMTCFKHILKDLNDSEGHCVIATDGECELDYFQSWSNSSESGDSTEGLNFSQKKNPRVSRSLMRPNIEGLA